MAATNALKAPGVPWYREPWPWILMAGPLAAVIGGIITAWIAIEHQDGLVAQDYYKEGLAINRTIDKERAAGRMGLSAQVQFSVDGRRLRVYLGGSDVPGGRLLLRFAHATITGVDQQIDLVRSPGGWFEGELAPHPPGKWQLLIEDPDAKWRVSGIWTGDPESVVTLEGIAN